MLPGQPGALREEGCTPVGASRQWDLLGAPQCLACVLEKEAETSTLVLHELSQPRVMWFGLVS